MKSSLENLRVAIKAFDDPSFFNNGNHLGLGTFSEFYMQFQLWAHAMECKRTIAQIYYGLINKIDPKHWVLSTGELHKPDNYDSGNLIMLMNGIGDFDIGINLAIDGYLTSLSSLLDCLSRIANALLFRRNSNNVSFKYLAHDCNNRHSSFEDIIVQNYYFPGNPVINSDTWTNHFKRLRNNGIHDQTFVPKFGILSVAEQKNPFDKRKLQIDIPAEYFDGLPTTTSHNLRTYVLLLNDKIDDFVLAAIKELMSWLEDQKRRGRPIPRH